MSHMLRTQTTIVLFIILVATCAFWNVQYAEFIDFDDDDYVTNNPHVRRGIAGKTVAWAFTAYHAANWHPLTWLSHALDCDLYGLNPRGHHVTSWIIHAINAVLLFYVLALLTRQMWPSAFVALLFACHPLAVESVAWISQRKNVLSTSFWLLTLLFYVKYAKHKSPGAYAGVLIALALGLMCKAMLVTLPFVLLLLDYWPLRRFDFLQGDAAASVQKSGRRKHSSEIQPGYTVSSPIALFAEKIPLFCVVAGTLILTFLAQQAGGAVKSFELYPLDNRVLTGLVAYIKYIGLMFWPDGLAVFYPHPGVTPPIALIFLAIFALAAVSWIALRLRLTHPYVAVGWLWYLGTLVPVIGIVQLGAQSMADRYTYVPLIGLYLIVVFGLWEFAQNHSLLKIYLFVGAVIVVGALVITTRIQVGYWRNTVTLFEHALSVTENNWLAHNNLGRAYSQSGKADLALHHLTSAIQINLGSPTIHNNFGGLWASRGKVEEAIRHFRRALDMDPGFALAHNNLGTAYLQIGNTDDAARHLAEAIRLQPDYAKAHNNLGTILMKRQNYEEARRHFAEALIIDPSYKMAQRNLEIVESLLAGGHGEAR